MAVRIKEWMIPYTWWIWIEITDNHVINVLLRELNNLIQVNEDRELYVDLQLEDWIQPEDDFPVGVTTWKILQEDWWDQSGIILNWKTTSGDYVRLIYANDWKLYYDPWTWVWVEIGWGGQTIGVATSSTLWTVKLGSDTVQTEPAQSPSSDYWKTFPVQLNSSNQAVVNVPYPEYSSLVEVNGWTEESLVTTGEKYIWNHKQDTLTPWTHITIQNGVISADINWVLTYKWNVTSISDLPASWTVWDTYFVEWEDAMYSWDWTQWNYVGGTGMDLSEYFNKTTDDSDDIAQGTTHLFVSTAEKNRWNAKQDALTAGENITISNQNVISSTSYTEWTWIDITNHVVTNTLPFEPENQWSLSQVLKRTSTGYRWENESWWGWWGWHTYYAGDGIAINNYVISNTAKFAPWTWTTGQVLKKTANGYGWENETAWEGNVKLFVLNSSSSQTVDLTKAQEAWDWYLAWKLPIVRAYTTYSYVDSAWTTHTVIWDFDYYLETTSGTSSTQARFISVHNTFDGYTNLMSDGVTLQRDYIVAFTLSWNTVTNVDITSATNWNTQFLSPYVNYTVPYTPQYNWSPATKKYVDDRNWIWTQAQYNLLPSSKLTDWVIYNILPSS